MRERRNTEPTSEALAGSPILEEQTQAFAYARSSKLRLLVALLALVAAGCATTYFVWHGMSGKEEHKKERSVPVTVARAQLSSVPIQLRSIGNVTPYSVVNITPQVSGQLLKVCFSQGQLVKKGDLLFQIDPRPYKAALAQAEGNVAKDKALIEAARANEAKDQAQVGQLEANLSKDKSQLTYASKEKGRYTELVEEGAVSHEQSDQMTNNEEQAKAIIDADKKAIENALAVVRSDRAQIATAEGTLKADEAAAENARIQLGWTEIRSPIEGRTSSLQVYQGNVVTANTSNPIVTIAQILPIYVSVTVPEQYLNDVRRAQQSGTLSMQALIEGQKADSVRGTISFIENTVNMNTGTIMLRASFENRDMHLYPGQFVDVVITMPPAGATVVVPAHAIQTTQQGPSVYVVNDNTVELRPVTVGQQSGENAAILEGLKSGEIVVTDGQLQLSPGAHVRIQGDKDEPSPEAAGEGRHKGGWGFRHKQDDSNGDASGGRKHGGWHGRSGNQDSDSDSR
jgi:multidrug efflux system membrane fusion protein